MYTPKSKVRQALKIIDLKSGAYQLSCGGAKQGNVNPTLSS